VLFVETSGLFDVLSNFVSYFVCLILCIFVFLCDILLPSGIINDDDDDDNITFL